MGHRSMKSTLHWDWQTARLVDGRLLFSTQDGLARALQDGFFFLDKPPGLCLEAGDSFAQNFYLPADIDSAAAINSFRNYRDWTELELGKYQGYFSRDVDQTEQFFLQSVCWEKVFPAMLCEQAEAMKALAISLLRSILSSLDIPEDLWIQSSGYCLSSEGTYTLTFNHFRPEIKARGLNVHKDSGWITVLRSLEPGLEVNKEGDWYPINPVADRFIVNFGCAMEILTKYTATPVAAVAHRVIQQNNPASKEDRFSYAMFLDSSLDRTLCPGLYTYKPSSGLELYADFEIFLEDILENTYRADSVGLY